MCELDAWLEPLEQALTEQPQLASVVGALLAHEPDQLLAMMEQRETIPPPLQPWLGEKKRR